MEYYPQVIDQRLWQGSQGLHGTLIVRVVDTQLRAEIERDHYENQCRAVVQTWLGSVGWSEVARVPIRDLKIYEHYFADDWQPVMERSLRRLIKLGIFVLFKQATEVEWGA